MMPATSVEPTVVAHVEIARDVPSGITTLMPGIVTMPVLVGTIRTFR